MQRITVLEKHYAIFSKSNRLPIANCCSTLQDRILCTKKIEKYIIYEKKTLEVIIYKELASVQPGEVPNSCHTE